MDRIMAIGAQTSPELVVVGTVSGVRPRTWEGEDRGLKVTIDTNGGPLNVGFGKDNKHDAQPVGTLVALVASVWDGQGGSSLTFVRHLTPGDLDQLLSASGLASASK